MSYTDALEGWITAVRMMSLDLLHIEHQRTLLMSPSKPSYNFRIQLIEDCIAKRAHERIKGAP